jgi:hypothetical protein
LHGHIHEAKGIAAKEHEGEKHVTVTVNAALFDEHTWKMDGTPRTIICTPLISATSPGMNGSNVAPHPTQTESEDKLNTVPVVDRDDQDQGEQDGAKIRPRFHFRVI